MGHLHAIKQEYRDLTRRLGEGLTGLPEPEDDTPSWQAWKEILEILYTPEEAELASRLPLVPTSLKTLAKRLQISAEDLQKKLEPMCDRGVVLDLVHPRTGEPSYLLAPPVIGFFEFSMMRAHDSIPKKRMAEALHAYVLGNDAFVREVFGTETVVGRALVHETALEEHELPHVLDWERATSLIEQARSLAVSHCYCRHKASHLGHSCDAPQEICLSMNGGAQFVIRREFGRRIERSEALEILVQARERGLVQIADNVQNQPSYICNCCGCCCGQLQAINDFGLPAVNSSGHMPRPDPAACAGCSRCARACPIGAITMKPVRVEATRKNGLLPQVDVERCIGCGVCASTCRKSAMKMIARPRRRRVPENAIERTLRMALERGRLGELLFDAGAGLGPWMLNRLLRGLNALPGVQRVLVSEQVSSRFIGAALARVPAQFKSIPTAPDEERSGATEPPGRE